MDLSKKGFSLLEIIIVLSLLTIIFSIIFIPFSTFYDNFIFKNFMSQIHDDLEFMRAKCLLDLCNRNIHFFADHYEIVVVTTTETNEKIANYPRGIKKMKGTSLGFNGHGIPTKAGTITFENNRSQLKKIILAPVSGRIRIE